MSRAPSVPSRIRAQRDRTVGSSRSSSSATRISVVPAGGSSSVLSSADWASSFIRSASRMIATRATPSTGSSDELRDEVADAALAVLAPDADLATRTLGREAVEIGVVAVLDHAAGTA